MPSIACRACQATHPSIRLRALRCRQECLEHVFMPIAVCKHAIIFVVHTNGGNLHKQDVTQWTCLESLQMNTSTACQLMNGKFYFCVLSPLNGSSRFLHERIVLHGSVMTDVAAVSNLHLTRWCGALLCASDMLAGFQGRCVLLTAALHSSYDAWSGLARTTAELLRRICRCQGDPDQPEPEYLVLLMG